MTFHEELEAAGHKLIKDKDGDIDDFILDYDYHNGPGCELCGERWCEHCENDIEECVNKEK